MRISLYGILKSLNLLRQKHFTNFALLFNLICMSKNSVSLIFFICVVSLSFCTSNRGRTFSSDQKECLFRANRLFENEPDKALVLIDSMLQRSEESKSNEAYMLEILKLKQLVFSKMKLADSSYIIGEKIREVASLIPDSLAMAETLTRLYGGVDYKHIKKAKKFIPGAISTFTQKGMPYEAAMVTALNGMVLSGEGDYVNAQKYFLKAYGVFEHLDSLKAIGKVCTNMANNYASIGSMDQSTLYYTKSLRIAEKRKDTLDQVAGLMNIGINYRLKSPDTAMAMYQRALQLLPANNSKLGMKLKFNLANLYLDKQDVNQAAAIMTEIARNCEDTKYMEGVGMANNGLAAVYFLAKRYPEALESYKKSIQVFNSVGLYQTALVSQTEMIDTYKAMGDYKNAFSNTEALQKIKDSLFSTEKEVAVHELEKKYQTEKKELENVYLKKNASIRDIALFILIIGVIALIGLLRKSNWLYKQRELAYSVLMDRYKNERLLRNRELEANMPSVHLPLDSPAELVENNSLMQRLEAYFETEKPYLNPKLKVDDVGHSLNCTQKEITLAFKTQDDELNFNIFANRFRVQEARRLIDDFSNMNLKLETIATRSGFGNRQSFYVAFEQFTGVKPGYYRKNILEQHAEDTA
jgi:tetratricopeptide (TPR) repeat protein